MDVKMIYLAERHPQFTREQWVARWRQHGGFCRTLPIWDHMRHYEQCVAIDGSQFVNTSVSGPQPGAAGWDGVGMIWFWSMEALGRAIDEPRRLELDAEELETFSGPVAATTLLAREVVLRDMGGVNAKIIAFIRRKPAISREQFSEYWEYRHAPLVLGCGGSSLLLRKYVLNHTLDATPEPMSAFDGVVEMGFASLEDAARLLHSPDYLADVMPDQVNFMETTDVVVLTTDESLLYEDALGQERILSVR
jgi:uncharacterized protein (TIGR02118 family)